MKTSETPEKLYVYRSQYWGLMANECITTKDDVEYTRTDAFINKVENFLEMLGYGFTITDNITHTIYDKEQLIEDFRNYMEGE